MNEFRINFERLQELVVFLAAKADVYSKDVSIEFRQANEIYLIAQSADGVRHGLKLHANGAVSYHTKQYIEV